MRKLRLFVVLLFVVLTAPWTALPGEYFIGETDSVTAVDKATVSRIYAATKTGETPSEDPPNYEEPYGIIVSENRGENSVADFVTTRDVPEGVIFIKEFIFPDGTTLVLPGWRMAVSTGDEIYQFPIWNGNLGVLWGKSGDVKVSVISFNPENGSSATVSDRIKIWSGSSTRKLPQIKYAVAENGKVRVGLVLSGGGRPEFFLDGRRLPQKSVLAAEDSDGFTLFPTPEIPFYEGERVLVVREEGGRCDTIRFRYFR